MAMIPTIQLTTSAGRQEVSLPSLHLSQRRIFLTGAIDQEQAGSILMQLMCEDFGLLSTMGPDFGNH